MQPSGAARWRWATSRASRGSWPWPRFSPPSGCSGGRPAGCGRRADAVRRPALGAAAVTAAALGIAWSVKAFYSHASVGELAWILSPTVRLVEWGTGASFAYEPDRGWLSRAHLFAGVAARAGGNFLIVAFCSLCFGLVGSCRTTPQRAGLLVGAGVAAYATTLLANATRIALALRLHDAAFEPAAEARLHRGLGIAVYFLFPGALLT